MNAIVSYYFFSQRYELDYVLFIKVESDLEHASPNAIHAKHRSHKIENHLEVRSSKPHFTALITTLHLKL